MQLAMHLSHWSQSKEEENAVTPCGRDMKATTAAPASTPQIALSNGGDRSPKVQAAAIPIVSLWLSWLLAKYRGSSVDTRSFVLRRIVQLYRL